MTPYFEAWPDNLHAGELGTGEKKLSAIFLTKSGASVYGFTTKSLFISLERFLGVCAKIAYGEYVLTQDKEFRSPSVCGFVVDGDGDA